MGSVTTTTDRRDLVVGAHDDATQYLTFFVNKERFAIAILDVKEILEIPATNIQPRPDFGTDIRTDFIHAMGRVEDDFIILLDINSVLSVEELSALEQARKLGQKPALAGPVPTSEAA